MSRLHWTQYLALLSVDRLEHTLPRVRQGLLTTLMALCVVTVVGMVAAINLAVPLLSASPLHPSPTALPWVVDSYVVAFACLLIPAGAAADRLGRKGILLGGLGAFTAGAPLSGCANDVTLVLAGRVLSGVGAAAVIAGEPGHPGRRRRAAADGLVAGVVLRRRTMRHWLSWSFVDCSCRARRSTRGRSRCCSRLAWWRCCWASRRSRRRAGRAALGAFAAAALLLGAWCVVELRITHPMLDPRLFAIPALRAHCLALVATFVGMFYLNGQYLQHSKGFSPFLAGLALLPMAVTLFFGPRVTVALASTASAPACSRRPAW